MDLRPFITRFRERFAEVEAQLSAPDAFAVPQRGQELTREHSRLKDLVAQGDAYEKTVAELAENRDLVASEPTGSELAVMAAEEIDRLGAAETRLAMRLREGIVPPDPSDSRNSILELRGAAGGAESALFAADLLRMYQRYAETQGWKFEILDAVRPTSAATRTPPSASPDRTCTNGSGTSPASTACSVCPPPRPRDASIPAPSPSP